MVAIQFLRVEDPVAICDALRREGWQLHAVMESGVQVTLPGVQKGKEIWASLDRLGLLTSSSVRIEFTRERSVLRVV